MKYCALFSSLLLLQLPFTAQAEDAALSIENSQLAEQGENLHQGAGTSAESTELPQSTNKANTINDEIAGTPGGGYAHPFLSVSGEYTDNLFNVSRDTQSNFLTHITPGIWLSLPQRKEVPVTIVSSNRSPGGLQMALPETEGFDRINAYLLAAVDFQNYSHDSELNENDLRVEGLFQVNLRGGLSSRIVENYEKSHDLFDVGNTLDNHTPNYNSNLILADMDWDISTKLRTKVEYSNFYLDYTEDADAFMNRTDNALSWYGYYVYSPKTSLYLGYQHIDLSYDTDELRDNKQNFLFAGIDWKSSEKTLLQLKAGYQKREYEDARVDTLVDNADGADDDAISLELRWLYQLTAKTDIALALNHNLEESDAFNALNKKVLAGTLQYNQHFSEKLRGHVALFYENADYSQVFGALPRDEDRYRIRPSLEYLFRDWLTLELAYEYDTRNSTDDLFDYDTNSFFLTLNAVL